MVRPLVFALALVASLSLALLPLPARAWGLLGHRLVALLAWDDLTPDTRRQIDALLQGEPDPTLAGIAGWADDLRKNDAVLGRQTANWHFVNIGEHGCAYLQRRDCPGGDCVVEAIRTQTAILADARRPRAERLQALKFVVHFVGDAHQPLHAGYGHDKGGNDAQINWNGRGTNMHTLWDSRMLVSTGRSEQAYLDHLRALPRPVLPAMTLPPPAAVWANQSCRVVTQPDFYPRRAKLEQAYVDKHLPIAERQLRAGGVALAAVLNKALRRR